MRKALVVGINYYKDQNSLYGCVNDAYAVKTVLERHGDGTINFDVKLLTATGEDNLVKKSVLKKQITELFKSEDEVVFYFSGHGHIEGTGGYLITSDCKEGDEGMPIQELMKIANESKAKNKIIILDSCHSGYAGLDYQSDNSLLSKGTTILTASSKDQYATEKNGSGVFTSLLVDALNGGAANLMGKITPGSVYAHIDQSLGPWQQRPLFKTNIENFVSLRTVQPPVVLSDLIQITSLFEEKGTELQLNPSFELESESPNTENTRKFTILQKYEGVGLVIPVGASKEHMYHAAMESKYCVLTLLGQHYWSLVKNKRI
ncbi:caspase domain-containing protein [Polaribacter sp. Hel1_85]|uniref:caspase family protein n=1 Tax=Polaribacter sp. Hel1_85 TaxID=1250005 RepID=UPI00052B6C73|nr:caspase family protein [Polaribacter sp. Hel1_85]KGL59114.1 peptidase, C14 family, caspase catalytic subunit p20 [Polaribacter sp. Hel1_85]